MTETKPTLHIHNTLTGKKEIFTPLTPGKISFYVCGVTVYDRCHIGHARAYVAFDAMRRYLEHIGYDVTYIQNFTDIDDKIIKRALEQDIDYQELTATYIDAYFEDIDALQVKRATKYPKATDYIGQMIKIIKTLIDKGVAYEVDGEVFCQVDKKHDYGKLSKKVLEDLEAGSRVEVASQKKHPLDFVLWKPSKPNEPSWNSPWGKGRPGWHIECSAMAIFNLGETIDIHGGGEDLVFPHHENEICQSESFTDKPFANYWVHNGFVKLKNEKMSKSTKNFFTIQDILQEFDGEVLRFYLLKMHYRSPLNFSTDGLNESKQALERLKNTLINIPHQDPDPSQLEQFDALEERFHKAMLDDFNYTEAIGVLFEINKLVNTTKAGSERLHNLCKILGIFETLEQPNPELPDDIMAIINERIKARESKDFQKSDELRDVLKNDHGILIEDTAKGPRWKKTTGL